MTKLERSPNDQMTKTSRTSSFSGFGFRHSFGLRHSDFVISRTLTRAPLPASLLPPMKRMLIFLALAAAIPAAWCSAPKPAPKQLAKQLDKADVLPLALDDHFEFRKEKLFLNDPKYFTITQGCHHSLRAPAHQFRRGWMPWTRRRASGIISPFTGAPRKRRT